MSRQRITSSSKVSIGQRVSLKKKKINYLDDNSFILSSIPWTSFSRSSLYSFNIASFSSFVRKVLTPYPHPQWPPQPYRIPFTSFYIGYTIYSSHTIYLDRKSTRLNSSHANI